MKLKTYKSFNIYKLSAVLSVLLCCLLCVSCKDGTSNNGSSDTTGVVVSEPIGTGTAEPVGTGTAEPPDTDIPPSTTDTPASSDTPGTSTPPSTIRPPVSSDTPVTSKPPITEQPPESSTQPPETSKPPETSAQPPETEPPIEIEEYDTPETIPDYSTLPENTESVQIVHSTVISDKILVEYIRGGGRVTPGFPSPIILATDDGYEFYDLSGTSPVKCESTHVNTTVEFDGVTYFVDFLFCISKNTVTLINDDCSADPPASSFRTAPAAIVGRSDAVVLYLFSSGEQYSEYPLLFNLADNSVEDIFAELEFEFSYPDNKADIPPLIPEEPELPELPVQPSVPTPPDGNGDAVGTQEAEIKDPPDSTLAPDGSQEPNGTPDTGTDVDPDNTPDVEADPINISSIKFNDSLTLAVVIDDLNLKTYLIDIQNNKKAELPYESYMHCFIDSTHLFYVISEADGDEDIPIGYCFDTQTQAATPTLRPDEGEATETRFISGSAYAIIIYTEREREAAVVDLLTGERIFLSGYDFRADMTVIANKSMTHLLFSNINDNYVTEDLAVLCLKSRSFKVLKMQGESNRVEIGTHFVSDNKIAIFSYLPNDSEHFYISLYTFEDFLTVEDEHNPELPITGEPT